MAYIVYGQGIVEIENRKTDVKEKDIFVVNPNTSVKFISKNSQKENYDFEIHYLLFEKDFLRGRVGKDMQMNLLNWNAFFIMTERITLL